MWADPDVTRFIGGTPSTRAQSWMRLVTYGGLWRMLGYGYWAVVERATGAYVGDVGFADFKREIEPPIEGVPEAGWVLSPSVHGRGYASEAVAAALAWVDANVAAARTVCIIAPENAPSIRVAQRAGYVEIARTTYKDEPTLMFERHRPS